MLHLLGRAIPPQGVSGTPGTGSGWGVTEAIRILESHFSHGVLQCIATGTPEGLLLTIERAEGLARHFEVIRVGPSSEDEALRVVLSAKEQLEKFHSVVFGEDAIRVATAASRRFLFGRQLPDRVIDLLDEGRSRQNAARDRVSGIGRLGTASPAHRSRSGKRHR